MNYQDLINNGLLKREKVGFDQINKVLERAYKNIKSACKFINKIEEFIQKKNPQKKLLESRVKE